MREYYELGLDIQKNYGIDDYMDIHSQLENNCNHSTLDADELDEMSENEYMELEQQLVETAGLIGLNTGDSQGGPRYQPVEADFPNFDYSNFPNTAEMLLFFIDPKREHIGQLLDPSPKKLTQGEIFSQMTALKQMDFIRARYEEAEKKGGYTKGREAAHLRRLCKEMKLDGLFSLDPTFMNITLREFLNVNENGRDYDSFSDVHKTGSGWRPEIPSFGSHFHQSCAPDTKGWSSVPTQPYNQEIKVPFYNRLNAKFCHKDGREAMFKYPGVYIDEGPDKGTYNYKDPVFEHGEHEEYDVTPFENRPPDGYKPATLELHNGPLFGNSYYWHLEEQKL